MQSSNGATHQDSASGAESTTVPENNKTSDSRPLCDRIPTPLTDGGKGVWARKIDRAATLPEYPNSDAVGYAYVVSTWGKTEKQIQEEFNQVRYSKGLKQPVKKTKCVHLVAWCNRYRWQCSGVKGCEHLHPDLQAFEHNKVDDDLLNRLESISQSIRDQFPENGEQCYVIKSQSTRRTTCEAPHQEDAKIISRPCPVEFNAFVPLDLNERPYYLWCSSRVHNHPPPTPPTKSPPTRGSSRRA